MKDLVAQLTSFFEASEKLRTPKNDLQRGIPEFLAALRRHLGEQARATPPTARYPVQAGQLAKMFATLQEPLATARLGGAFLDVWSVAGLGRSEVRNAAALAALWNPRLCPEIAVDFLNSFLRRLDRQGPLPSHAQLATGYYIQTEDCPMGDAADRVDVTLEGNDFLLGVEIKIDAPEGPNQIQRYRSVLNTKAGALGKTVSLIFLSPRPPTESGTIHATWKDIAAAARQVGVRKPGERRFPHHLLGHYAARASTFK